jgi:hypothetical protein
MTVPDEHGSWTLLTGHGHVLVEIARNPEARIRDISAACGITERTVQAIIADLETAGYITRDRAGRRNQYTVNRDNIFRHPAQDGHRVGPLLDLLTGAGGPDDGDTGDGASLAAGRDLARASPAAGSADRERERAADAREADHDPGDVVVDDPTLEALDDRDQTRPGFESAPEQREPTPVQGG